MSADIKIDFAIVGQPKSGTTAMADFLDQHPDVCMSVPKEPGYFATDHIAESDAFYKQALYYEIRTPAQYSALFNHGSKNSLKGEASTNYLYSKDAANNMYNQNPDTKIIIMLRNPVDMIHSLHMQYLLHTMEDVEDFEKALQMEPLRMEGQRIPKNTRCPSLLFYMQRTLYHEQISRYFKLFDKSQIKIVLMEEFVKNNPKFVKQIYSFLGADSDFTPNYETINASKSTRLKKINELLNTPGLKNTARSMLGQKNYTRLHQTASKILLKPQKRQNMSPELRKQLMKKTQDTVKASSEILGTNLLSLWGYDDIDPT